ncbi:MAG: hypothetical protein ACOY3V_06025 [Pseudomonadota bacterium]
MLKRSFLILAAIFLGVVGASRAMASNISIEQSVIEKITATLPAEWSIVETKDKVIPEGHYWDDSYGGVRGVGVQLEGPANVHIRWLDASKSWHYEAIAREALWLYIMPPSYAESAKRHLKLKRPVPAVLIHQEPRYQLYAYPTSRVVQKERMDSILKESISTEWPDSPRTTRSLSWKNWQSDIKGSLSGKP